VLRPGTLVTHSMGRRFEGWSNRCGARRCVVLLVCAGLALTLGVAALFAGSGPSFGAARSYRTGDSPVAIAIGDLSGDGKPDLATANSGSESVSVLVNKGDGSVGPKRSYVVGTDSSSGPSSVAIGDLNADGKADIVAAKPEEGTVSVLLNSGDGRFQARHEYRAGGGASSVAIGDLNRDGALDLAITGDARRVSVLLNRGDGSFQAARVYRTGGYSDSVAIGDLNGDGKADLANANSTSNTVSVLLNKGDGTFRAKRDYRTGGDSYSAAPASVAIGDLNADGKPDLATANEDADTVSVLLNRGHGRFQAKRDYKVVGAPQSVAIGDLNGDGKPDLATANAVDRAFPGADRASVLTNMGGGRFRARLDYPTGMAPVSVAIGDLNGDGRADLATANPADDNVSVLLNKPGLCTVQGVRGRRLPVAKRTLARANCRVGKIRRIDSGVGRGRVITQRPAFGAVLPGGSKVNLVVSRVRKPS
jgi:FG-GAP-like repeat/PASTA domain/FG-GAP repeat